MVEGEEDDGWKALTIRVLDDWRDHGAVEDNWKTIQNAVTQRAAPEEKALIATGRREPLSPLPLIDWVIDQAIVYKRLCDDVIPKSENLENRAIAAAEKEWRHGTDLSRAAGLKETARQNRAYRVRLLGRQPKMAPQKRFIRLCREMLMNTCGQPLDQVNEMLTSVVVGHALNANAIRDALKATTRKGRDTR
jgi:hypothetical protein